MTVCMIHSRLIVTWLHQLTHFLSCSLISQCSCSTVSTADSADSADSLQLLNPSLQIRITSFSATFLWALSIISVSSSRSCSLYVLCSLFQVLFKLLADTTFVQGCDLAFGNILVSAIVVYIVDW